MKVHRPDMGTGVGSYLKIAKQLDITMGVSLLEGPRGASL